MQLRTTQPIGNGQVMQACTFISCFFHFQPQQSIPDVFIWMISEKKRIAYYRFAAKDLLDATDNAFKGKHCGKLQTIFLKVIILDDLV